MVVFNHWVPYEFLILDVAADVVKAVVMLEDCVKDELLMTEAAGNGSVNVRLSQPVRAQLGALLGNLVSVLFLSVVGSRYKY